MKDLTLDFENKRVYNKFITDRDLVLQQVKVVVQIWQNDWYLDYSNGIDYRRRFGNKPMLLADLENAILSVSGVTKVSNLDLTESIVDGLTVYNITGNLTEVLGTTSTNTLPPNNKDTKVAETLNQSEETLDSNPGVQKTEELNTLPSKPEKELLTDVTPSPTKETLNNSKPLPTLGNINNSKKADYDIL